uniref:PH domain-containing protein n=1 Tax=Globisporangium ultimum (strain ATCC 200006 / CBS 805.95 / DAOM BR144) TaxID=431595 RepID=K3X6N7_GLOUD
MVARGDGEFSGWGSKQGSKVKTWKTRFFVLRGTDLAYFSGTDEKGRLRVVDVDFAPDLPNGLLVRGEKKGKVQTLKMKTATADESKLWFAKLKHAVAVADEVGDAGGVHRTLSYRTRSASGLRAGSIGTGNANTSMAADPYPQQQQHSQQQAQLPRQMSVYPAAAASVPTWTSAPPPLGSKASSYEKSASEQRIRKKGWLLKEGKRMKNWKKRFVVLRGNVLSYYADETPSSPPLGSLVIRQVETNFTTPFTLDVHTEGGRILRIAADSLDDIEAWDLVLSQAVSGDSSDNQEMDSRTTASLSSASSYDRLPSYENQSSIIEDLFASTLGNEYPPASYDVTKQQQRHHTLPSSASSQTCEGWLLKQGHKSKRWKRRYFTLNNDMLEYRHEPQDVPNEDEIIVDVDFDASNDGWIHIELDSGRTITVRAESHEEFMRWAVVLGELVGKPHEVEDASPMSESSAMLVQYREDASPVKMDLVKAPPSLSPSIVKPEVKYGWLLKQGHLIRSWKQRYFVLHGDSLQYFENIDKPPRGGGIVVHVLRDTVDQNCLDVHLANGRVLKISADARDDLNSWYDALQNASKLGAEATEDQENQVEETNLDNSGNRLGRLGQEGWLLKKGQNFKTWKQRYFVLERSRLMYYDDEGGELLGSGVVFEVSVGEARPFCIDVRFQNGRLLEVVAPDETQFAQWLKALQTSSNLTESFLSQHDECQQENAVFDDEFDLDFADDGENYEDDLDFGNQYDNDEDARKDDSGYATWEAAMENKPEWDRADSWDSALGDEVDESAGGEEQSQASESHNTPTMLADQSNCHGWLNKQGGTIKTWKRRYFSLHGTTLRYFKRETGSMLRSFTISHVEKQPQVALGLEVMTTSGRKLMLTAESKEDYGRWLRALQASISAESSVPKSPTAPVQQQHDADAGGRASNVSATVNNDGKIITSYSGWLEKEGQRFKTWKKRYFTYKKGALIYYGEIGGVAHGHGIVTNVRVDDAKPFTLSVSLEGDRILRVSAASSDEVETWLRVLSSTLPSPVETSRASEQRPSATSSPASRESADPQVVSRGEAREQIASNRLDASDYLANDTISNESFVRINDGYVDPSVRVQTSFNTGRRSFKGELNFSGAPEEHVVAVDTKKTEFVRMESEDNLEYYRKLMAENEAEQERRAGEKDDGANSINSCAACCVLM